MTFGRRKKPLGLQKHVGSTAPQMPRDNGARRVDLAIAGFRRSNDRSDRTRPRTRGLEAEPTVTERELAQLVHEYRHLLEDHRRAKPRSRARRKLEQRMAHTRAVFDVRLAQAPIGERDRRLWRDRLHGEAAAKSALGAIRQLLFRGRSESGSELLLSLAADGTVEAVVDGGLLAVLDRADELQSTAPGFVLRLDDASFRETFSVSRSTLDELRVSLETGRSLGPESVPTLIAEGLVDGTRNLTARGRRALALDRLPARHVEHAPVPAISVRGPVPLRARDNLARALAHVTLDARRPVLRVSASLTRSEDPALPRPVVARASLDVNGQAVRAHATAASESEAIALLESRLHRKLRGLTERDLKGRREGLAPGHPGCR
jgi:hypothetical protein